MPNCEFHPKGTSASIANITHWTTTFLVTRFFKDVQQGTLIFKCLEQNFKKPKKKLDFNLVRYFCCSFLDAFQALPPT